ncbi:MAG: site-specific DNA-methyltransferase [Myxococcota bacterium]|nr:site-specific DNA-methyltransferase [Myxococcota bacterium]
MKRRRSLSHVGGAVETEGSREVAMTLAEALDVAPAAEPTGQAGSDPAADDPDRAHIHGFHTYPARMHPTTAARLVRSFAQPGATLLDPFCGSGTVLVETLVAGRRAIGIDLHPLAVRLSRVKTNPRDARSRDAIVATARAVSAIADERRKRRAGATHRYPAEDVTSFEPHVLLELDSLRAGIAERGKDDVYVREALELVLSAIFVKVSRRTSDTSTAAMPRRIAAGYAARLFGRKAADLSRRLGELAELVPSDAKPVQVFLDDAARLQEVLPSTVDAIVTSPPYVATYDYVTHHALRLRWLGLDARGLDVGEMGARRRYAALEPRAAREAWTRELAEVLRALSRACRKGARVAIVLGDSAIGGEALRADSMISTVAPGAGFALVARASQRRPHFHGPTVRAFREIPRAEHAIALEKR